MHISQIEDAKLEICLFKVRNILGRQEMLVKKFTPIFHKVLKSHLSQGHLIGMLKELLCLHIQLDK